MSYKKKILIVDDESKIVEVVKSYLEKEGYEVFEAYRGNTAIDMFEKINLDLVILDLMLPDMTGEKICEVLREKSSVPIIMLTAKVGEEDILNGFDIGADDYITKPFSPRQLIARVAALLRRTQKNNVNSSNIMSFNDGELIIDDLKHEVRKNSYIVNLTSTEYKILMTMAKYPKKAFTREELVYIVLGEDYDGFDRVIDTHVKNIRHKIETDIKDPRYIVTIHGLGYRFGGE